jgi:hypothetical protein
MARLVRSARTKRLVKAKALRKGVLGGSVFWRGVYGYLTFRKMWKHISKRGDAPLVFGEKILEGEAWALVHVPEDSRRGRGEGRKLLIGPKRKPPHATALVPAAVQYVGRKIVAAPDAERINEILGDRVVSDPEPTRRKLRQAKREAKKTAKSAASLT